MSSVEEHNFKAQTTWNSPAGRYEEISRSIADAIEHAVERLQPQPGEHILDLATGTGWGSRVIAQRFPGVNVTGVDIADQMLAHATASATRLGLDIEYRHADAERLPFPDGAFDAVLSTFGVMFAGRPEAAAAELSRVVRKGGRIALATWRHDSNVSHMFGVMKKFMQALPQSGPPSAFEWGRYGRLHDLLGNSFALDFEEGTNHFRYPSGERAWNLWVNHYGPTKALASSLDDAHREQLKNAFVAWHEGFRSALGYDQPRQYITTHGIRK